MEARQRGKMRWRDAPIICTLLHAMVGALVPATSAQPAKSDRDAIRSDGATIGMVAGCTTDAKRLNADRRAYLSMLHDRYEKDRAIELGEVFASGVNVGTKMLSIARTSGADLHCSKRLADLADIEQRLTARERR